MALVLKLLSSPGLEGTRPGALYLVGSRVNFPRREVVGGSISAATVICDILIEVVIVGAVATNA
jgi:hypothetical protein